MYIETYVTHKAMNQHEQTNVSTKMFYRNITDMCRNITDNSNDMHTNIFIYLCVNIHLTFPPKIPQDSYLPGYKHAYIIYTV